MGQVSEEQLTTDIEGTRQDLSRNLDELNDKVNPSRVIERRKEATRSRFVGMKDKVMGSAQSASPSGAGVGDKVSGAKDSVSDSAQGAVQAVEARTEGNPLAAGVVAFGAGWLISSIIPASQKEADAAARLVETAKEHGQPVVDEAKSMGQDIGQNLKEKAADAAEEVKSSAQSSAENVKQEGQSSAQTVKDDAQQKM